MIIRRIARSLGGVLAALSLALAGAGAASAVGGPHDTRARAVPDITVTIDTPTEHQVAIPPITISTLEGVEPNWQGSWTGVVTNNTDQPMEVTFERLWIDGTIAPFIELGFEGWQDVTLQPGESSAQFTITAMMPSWTGNAAQGTSGTLHAVWNVVPVGSPPIPPKPPCKPGSYGEGYATKALA
ncbi:hypothetical protein [Streptomyces laurentii]|uniref:hypothetical protein n=1 Tax=Streptomyces laurentii TaxID=39478 RepID=UPI003698173A